MPKQVDPLTALATRNAKPHEKPYKLAAGRSLYLEVMPSGSRYWQWKYRDGGKERHLAPGVFPEAAAAPVKERHLRLAYSKDERPC